MKIKIRNPFSRSKKKDEGSIAQEKKKSSRKFRQSDVKNVIEQDIDENRQIQVTESPDVSKKSKKGKSRFGFGQKEEKKEDKQEIPVRSRNGLERFSYNVLSSHLPGFNEFKEAYGQSGIPLIYEAYISTGFLLSILLTVPAYAISFIIEIKAFPHSDILLSVLGSAILSGTVFGITLVLWLTYPLVRRHSYKSKLESQLAYSFGILGVLAAGGMNLERLFERIASSESNPVLADLAKRFLRNIRVFGLDTETALAEVAQHSPSEAFAKMLDSISVAHKTTGSIHDLVMFESARLLQEKKDKLRKTIGSLAVMAELYITIVVVGPIIFIVMMAIFGLLPAGGLPDPISIINLIVFIGIPVLSVMFILLLDSVVSKA
jgi:flagellar protein FlaJ